jgi:hypothetical protein
VSRIYSTLLLAGESETGEEQVYGPVPAGFVAVVRDLTCAQVGAGAGNLTEWIVTPPSGDGLVIAYMATPDTSSSLHLELRVVMPEGWTLTGASEGGPTCHLTASGYLLSSL